MRKKILGNTFFIVQTNALVACFDKNINFKIVDEIKDIETKKINYAKKYFDALGHADIKYDVIATYEDLRDKVMC